MRDPLLRSSKAEREPTILFLSRTKFLTKSEQLQSSASLITAKRIPGTVQQQRSPCAAFISLLPLTSREVKIDAARVPGRCRISRLIKRR